MNDLEISKALALAIGWKNVQSVGEQCYVKTANAIDRFKPKIGWPFWIKGRVFDYRDWNVIGPIATRYGLFPERFGRHWVVRGWFSTQSDTPQKAIAHALLRVRS